MDTQKKNVNITASNDLDLEAGDHEFAKNNIDKQILGNQIGSWFFAKDIAHMITAVIGFLIACLLAWAMTHFVGWIAGHSTLIMAFSAISYYTFCNLQPNSHRRPVNPLSRKENYTYMDADQATLGKKKVTSYGIAQYLNLVGVTIGYTIAACVIMVVVKKSDWHDTGHKTNNNLSNFPHMIIFAAIQIVLSRIPKFLKPSWLSIVVIVVMSLAYLATGHVRTSLSGIEVGVDLTGAKKVWITSQAIADIAFAYAYSTFLIWNLSCYHKNMCERPSLKKQKQKQVEATNQVLKRCSDSTMPIYVGLNLIESKKPTRNSSYVTSTTDLNEKPQSHIHPLMDEISAIFHPYISCIKDVRGDGNCGFRAISVCLGHHEGQWMDMRRQLLEELYNNHGAYAKVFGNKIHELQTSLAFFGIPAPREHWMIMPLTGILIANSFGVIVIYLTERGPSTIFPLWRAPEEFPHHQMITIAFVNGNHYVMVELERGFPMPTISTYWIRHKGTCADGWKTKYMSRFIRYQQLMPRNHKEHFITDK